MDKIKEAILSSNDPQAMLEYCTNTCLILVSIRDYRHQVSIFKEGKTTSKNEFKLIFFTKIFALLVELYHTLENPDYLTVCRILVFLDDSLQTAEILVKLVNSANSVSPNNSEITS